MTQKRRWILVGFGVLVTLLVLSRWLGGSAVEVETAVATRDTLREVVQEEGRTRVADRFVVAAPITGRLARIGLDEGRAVVSGEVVARIYSLPEDPRTLGVTVAQLSAAEARRLEAAARVEESEGRAAQASREAARRRELAEAGALSREAREQAELEAVSAQRRLDAARASLAAAAADVQAMRASLRGANPEAAAGATVDVRAPATGRVLRVLEESERVVQAGTPLLEIGDASGLEVVVDVLSEDAVRVRPGNLVLVEEWGEDHALHGRVRMVEPDAFTEVSALGVEEQRVNVIVDLAGAPPSLGGGYRVEASIVTWSGVALSVPTSALFTRDEGWLAFVVENGRAVLREVELGHRSAESAEILAGIAEGEDVILFPSDLIEEGVRVEEVRGNRSAGSRAARRDP